MSKRRSRGKHDSSKTGLSFELAIATMQRLLDPASTVTHDEWLIDRVGHSRQFDVVIRGRIGGHEVLGVIECKDYKRPVGTPEINAFADKAKNVRANLVMFASRSGFTKPALELAQFHGIGTLSLLRSDLVNEGFTIGSMAYAEIFSWERIQFVSFFDKFQPAFSVDPREIYFYGQNLSEWFLHKLFSQYVRLQGEGKHKWELSFAEPAPTLLGGVLFRMKKVHLVAERTRQTRSKLLAWSGRAMYDWNQKTLMLPENCALESTPFSTDARDWDPFDGEIPPFDPKRPFQLVVQNYQNYGELPVLTVDLAEHGDFREI